MALLGNYNVFLKCPVTNTGGDSTSGIVGLRSNWNVPGVSRNRFYGDNWLAGTADRFGVPSAYSSPYAWTLPPHSGGIGSNIGLQGIGTITGSGALGINIDATMAGSGDISSANLGLILSAVATLSGIGGLSADILGKLDGAATLAGSGDFSGSLGALAGAVATLAGTGSMTGSTTALANISADIFVNSGTATTVEIVDAVWNSLAVDYNTSGTMGNKLNGAGSAGDPWTTDLDSYTTPGTAGALLKKASKPKISL